MGVGVGVRMRLVWFSVGFGSAAALMSHFVYKDLLLDRHSFSSQLKHKFDSLESRLENLRHYQRSNSPNEDPAFRDYIMLTRFSACKFLSSAN